MADESKQKSNLPPNDPLHRKNIRYRIFRIREGNDPVQDDLKQHLQDQFQFGMSWKMFTFTWDVSPTEPLKIIVEDQWEEEGGGYDRMTGIKAPSAFTHQA